MNCIKLRPSPRRPRLLGVAAACLILSAGPPVYPCGPFFPNWLLVDPHRSTLAAPYAIFEREIERMQLIQTARRARPSPDYGADTLAVELEDLRTALERAGASAESIKLIIQAHRAERQKITLFAPPRKSGRAESWRRAYVLRPSPTNNTRIALRQLPHIAPGLPGEFADYFRGSVAWHQGDIAGARDPWLQLLKRPDAERQFKSTWASFMLGKSWEQDAPARAIARYRQVRALADAGFADSLGLSVASLGWEARLHRQAKRYVQATELYLEQAAAGDASAPLSLRFVARDALDEGLRALQPIARHPRAQRVVTAYVIAGGYARAPIDVDSWLKERALRGWTAAAAFTPKVPPPNPSWHTYKRPVLLWLEAVETARVRDVDSAEQLALAAYQAGDMTTAARWLQRARTTALTQWLQAKLLLRDGKTDAAAALLAALCRQFPVHPPPTNAPPHPGLAANLRQDAGGPHNASFQEQVRAELGLAQLARRQFVEALDALLHSTDAYWMDAAYVAERVLTLPELQMYVDRHWPAAQPLSNPDPAPASESAEPDALASARQAAFQYQSADHIRYLLARRLARAGRLAEARTYFPAGWLPLFDKLLAAHQSTERSGDPAARRAWAQLEAARLTRRYGLELLGTEVEPDWRIHAGNFTDGVSRDIRATLTTNLLPATAEELQRAAEHGVEPDERWHYRHTAALLAWKAGQFLCTQAPPTQPAAERAQVLLEAAQFTLDHDISRVLDLPFPPAKPPPAGKPEDVLALLWQRGYTAAALAWDAARLLPDNSDETARTLCQGGIWIKALDPQTADFFYKALVHRCHQTALGAEADRLRWFPK